MNIKDVQIDGLDGYSDKDSGMLTALIVMADSVLKLAKEARTKLDAEEDPALKNIHEGVILGCRLLGTLISSCVDAIDPNFSDEHKHEDPKA